MAVRSIWYGKIDPRRTILLGLGTTAGFALSYAIVSIWTGFDWFVAFRDLYLDAMHFHDASNRDYWTWVIANPWEFFFGVGTCQAVLFVAVLWQLLHGPGGFRRDRVQPIGAFAAGCLASLVALDLSGVSRGEVIRIWIFLACLLQVPDCRMQNGRA